MARGDAGRRTGGEPDPLRSIDWGSKLDGSVADVYFAPAGAQIVGVFSFGWTRYEKEQALEAFAKISEVIRLEFREARSLAGADFGLATTPLDRSLAEMAPPDEPFAGLGLFDPTGLRGGVPRRDGVLDPGSFGFKVLLHEFGHGLGLAHPHDRGGASTVWAGVDARFDDFGRANLNQGVYSVMSYNDGWPDGPSGPPFRGDRFGYEASMMALDIAALQAKYGANLRHATGDDVYRLPDRDAKGTGYACIWDAGGYDTIAASGRGDAIIDLRDATLRGEPGGGGWVSHVQRVGGGFTIANGVEIEAARGGGGDDILRGAYGANRLLGGDGDDALLAGGGRNSAFGGRGDDILVGGIGGDALAGGVGADTLAGGPGDDALEGGGGRDVFRFGAAGGSDVIVDFVDGVDRVRIDADGFGDLALREVLAGARVRVDDLRITFEGVDLAALDAADFVFG